MSEKKRLADQMQMKVVGNGDGVAFVIGLVLGIISAAVSFWLVG